MCWSYQLFLAKAKISHINHVTSASTMITATNNKNTGTERERARHRRAHRSSTCLLSLSHTQEQCAVNVSGHTHVWNALFGVERQRDPHSPAKLYWATCTECRVQMKYFMPSCPIIRRIIICQSFDGIQSFNTGRSACVRVCMGTGFEGP